MTVWFTSGLSIAAWVKPGAAVRAAGRRSSARCSRSCVSPWSQAQSVEYQRLLASRDDVSSVTPGVFRESRSSDRVFFVDKLSEGDDVGEQRLRAVDAERPHGRDGRAERGFIETAENGDRFVVLLNGRRYEGTPGTLDYRTVDFDRYAMRIEPREATREAPSNKAMATLDLLDRAHARQVAELHWRIALPLAVLIMALFADPARLREPALGPLVEPDPRGAHLRALQQPALDLPGLDRAGKDPRLAGPLAGAPRDGRDPAGALLAAALRCRWLAFGR